MHEMLQALAPHFELILFTSGEAQYASVAIDCIEAENSYFQHRLTKNHCLQVKLATAEFWAKDLRILTGPDSGRSLESIIVVDNLISNFIYHTRNCVPIKDYNGEADDQVLKHMTEYLLTLRDVECVTEKISSDFYNPIFRNMI
jgi:carboxy-terminal domain RNA polymerase II polypeptide A small phosphatase